MRGAVTSTGGSLEAFVDSRFGRAGRVRYDPDVTAAQLQSHAVVERPSGAADDIRVVWANLLTSGATHGARV